MIYVFILIMTLFGSFASYFLKKASFFGSLLNLLKNKNVYIGGILYVISAVINVYVLKYLPYSIVLPLTSFTYVWTMIISHLLLNEYISKRKIIGLVLIILGSFILVL